MMLHISNPNNKSNLTNVNQKDIQPNAVDLRVGRVFQINPTTFSIKEEFMYDKDEYVEGKLHRGTVQIALQQDGCWHLEPGSYEIIMTNHITIGPDEAGWVITRSTLNRNGVFITSGLYDSGYSGVMAGVMHVTTGKFILGHNTRVGQFLLFKAEMLNLYSGSYGAGSDHDKKYGE